MSLYSYKESQQISSRDPNFDALIMSAMRKADTFNTQRLRETFPEIHEEFFKRYNAPGGVLDGEESFEYDDEEED